MNNPQVGDFVRLIEDLPESSRSRGDVGIVRSTWCAPSVAYEVEFSEGEDPHSRVIVSANQIVVETVPLDASQETHGFSAAVS